MANSDKVDDSRPSPGFIRQTLCAAHLRGAGCDEIRNPPAVGFRVFSYPGSGLYWFAGDDGALYTSSDVRAQSEGTLVLYTGSVEYDVLEKAVRNGAPEVMTIQDRTMRESLEFLREQVAREGEDPHGVMVEDQDLDESFEASEDTGEAPATRPRGSVWHAPFSLSILLLAWSVIILVAGIGSWWGRPLFGISCFNLFVAVATAIIYGRYKGPFIGKRKP